MNWLICHQYIMTPFDRLIIAQAKIENLILITKDKTIPKYDNIKVLWS